MGKKRTTGSPIEELRKEVNRIDGALITLLSERRKISLKIIKEKTKSNKPVREKEREAEIIERIKALALKKKIDPQTAEHIFNEIIEDSVKIQQNYTFSGQTSKKNTPKGVISLALQGIEGSYSHLAGEKYFYNNNLSPVLESRTRFEDVFASVETGEADYAILPIENTTSGGINEVYDLLLNTHLIIRGEVIQKVNHCLAATAKTPLNRIKKIYAHYQAAAQCSRFIDTLEGCTVEFFPDTAMSFRKLKEEGNKFYAAIAGEGAADIYGLKILKKGIANQTKNYTRFLILSGGAPDENCLPPFKSSLIFTTEHKPGALNKVLAIFSKQGINITKLESRPAAGNPWHEMFYLDFVSEFNVPALKKIMKQVERNTKFFKILGFYKEASKEL